MPEALVVDASVLVDLMVSEHLSERVGDRMEAVVLHAPGHLDAEVLSALGRLQRGGDIAASSVTRYLADLADAPIRRHPVAELVVGAWRRRAGLRLADALYVELAHALGARLLTTDARLARAAPVAELAE